MACELDIIDKVAAALLRLDNIVFSLESNVNMFKDSDATTPPISFSIFTTLVLKNLGYGSTLQICIDKVIAAILLHNGYVAE